MQDERYSAIECILFVSGEPVSLVQLQRALDITGIEMNAIIHNMETVSYTHLTLPTTERV